jgi:hypothetical protein
MKQIKFSKLLAVMMMTILFSSCKKDPVVTVDNSASSLIAGRAGISFNTNENFGNSKIFNVRNTAETMAVTQFFGTTKRYMVIKAEVLYGGLADTRKTTLYITVPPNAGLPIIIDLAIPQSVVPSGQVELYYSYLGTAFGNTYRSVSGELRVTKLTATEIEGSFTATANGSIAPGFIITNGTFAGKF